MRGGLASASRSETYANNGTDGWDDEDVPLAQRIPSALTALRTIRHKVREERDQQRRERAAREARSRPTTLRPAGAGALIPLVVASSSSREAAREAMGQAARQKIQTLPGNGASRRRLTKKMQTQKERKQQALRAPRRVRRV
jgi:hypothetical protein